MISINGLVQDAARVFMAKRTASFFVSGAPGSGCSLVSRRLQIALPEIMQKLSVLGPYVISLEDIAQLPKAIAEDLSKQGFARNEIMESVPDQLHHAWMHFSCNLEVARNQSFLVIIDIADPEFHQYVPLLADMFSAIRSLESNQLDQNFGLYHAVTGFWNPVLLADYYKNVGVSFPYTKGENYHVWNGMNNEEALEELSLQENSRVWTSLLVEITGGHFGAMQEANNALGQDALSFRKVVQVVDQIAKDGSNAQNLVDLWGDFAPDILSTLEHIVINNIINLDYVRHSQELMRAAGIGKLTHVADEYFLEIRSWYIERVIVHHTLELGFDSEDIFKYLVEEPSPHLVVFNQQAYELLNDIETKVRRFVGAYLYRHNDSDAHILKDQLRKYDNHTKEIEDAYQRASNWKKRSQEDTLHTNYNTLLAYCLTSDLADLTNDIGIKQNRPEWQEVSRLVRKLVPIRNAVMHNQLIDESSLNLLFALQKRIYALLGDTAIRI